jgi:hypothetical protein
LVSGQTILQDLVERQGIPVFNSIPIALNCTAKVNTSRIQLFMILKLRIGADSEGEPKRAGPESERLRATSQNGSCAAW